MGKAILNIGWRVPISGFGLQLPPGFRLRLCPRKMKGEARNRLKRGRVVRAEIRWYKAHGIGKKEFKRKRYLD
jgi:hypothetical protein